MFIIKVPDSSLMTNERPTRKGPVFRSQYQSGVRYWASHSTNSYFVRMVQGKALVFRLLSKKLTFRLEGVLTQANIYVFADITFPLFKIMRLINQIIKMVNLKNSRLWPVSLLF